MAIKIGTKAVNVLNGGAGNDFLFCYFGTNTLNGGAGNDSLFGGSGKDTLRGGAGSDRVYAGSGNDTIIHDVAHDQGKYDIYDGGRGIDTLVLEVSQSFLARADVQNAINAFTSKALPAGNLFSFAGYVPGWNLTIKGIEKLEIKIKGALVSPKVAINDVINTQEDAPLVINAAQLLANDEGGNAILGVDYSGPGNLNFINGVITYIPVNNYHGLDTFKYTISNGLGGTSVATVTLHVNSVNDAPIATDDGFSTTGDIVISVEDLLVNDLDVDGDTLTVTSATSDGNGTIQLLHDPATGELNQIKYTPASSFTGLAHLTYTVSDGQANAQGTIQINVSADNGHGNGDDGNGSGPGGSGNNGSGDDGSTSGGGTGSGSGSDGSATSGGGTGSGSGSDGSATSGGGTGSGSGSDGSATAGSGTGSGSGSDGSATAGSGTGSGSGGDGSATAGSGVNTGVTNDGSATAGSGVNTTGGATASNSGYSDGGAAVSVTGTASGATVSTGTLNTLTDAAIAQVLTGNAVTDETQWRVGSSLDSSNVEVSVLGVNTVYDELWAG